MPPLQSLISLLARGVLGLSIGVLSLVVHITGVFAASGFEAQSVVSGLTIPTALAFAPDGRIFVAEKGGAVRVIKNETLSSTPVITLTDVNTYGDRGLIGIAIDPDFATNGYLYLSYTYENSPGANTAGPKTGRIVRVTVIGDTALGSSRVVLLGTVGGTLVAPSCEDYPVTADCIPSDDASHSVGGLQFGQDGYLYASLGDGASFDYADPRSLRAQNLDSLAGKVIRIRGDGTAPSDNPFYDGNASANRSKVWALGVRNMFRFAFQPGTNILFGGDVGWSTWEELDIVGRGVNLGWPCYEGVGTTVGGLAGCSTTGGVTPPLYQYQHDPQGAGSIVGGDFVGSAFPSAYIGSYVYGDYALNTMTLVTLGANNTIISQESLITDPGGPVDIKTAPDGSLYYIAIYTGEVKRVIYTLGNRKPLAVLSTDISGGPLPITVTFSASGSSDPDGDTLSYSWDFGDGNSATGALVTHTYITDGTYDAILMVRDGSGGVDVRSTRIFAGNQRPSVTILSPTNGSTYHTGDIIRLIGTGVDPETGVISGSGFAWQVLLHHNIHTHILQSARGPETTFVAPDHSATDIYVEIILTVTDPSGFASTSSVNMYLNNGQATAGNVIRNPGMEANTVLPDTPDNWIRGWFGNNEQVWTYPVLGDTSQKAAKVEITQYISGDAKWAHDPVSVVENMPYIFSDSYQSNIVSNVIVDIGFANGTHSFYILGTLSASPVWQTFTRAFTTPAGARTASVYHSISGTGWITTDNYVWMAGSSLAIPPIARDDIVTGVTNTTFTIPDILANDQAFGSGNSLYSSTLDLNILISESQTTLVLPEGTVTVSPSSGIVTFVPMAGFNGRVMIPYSVEDSLGQRAQASIIITISAPVGNPTPQTLFFGGFEDQTFDAWDSSRGSNFIMSDGTCRLGPDTNLRAMKIVGTDPTGNQTLRRSISTLGYNDIRLSFCYKWDTLEVGDSVVLEYTTNGTTWTPIKTIDSSLAVHMFYAADDAEIATSNGVGVIPTPILTTPEALSSHSIMLPADAADAPGFALRIRENLGDSNDFVWIDDIRIVGTPIVMPGGGGSGTGTTGTGTTGTGTTGTGTTSTGTTGTGITSGGTGGGGGGGDGGGSISSSVASATTTVPSTTSIVAAPISSGITILARDLIGSIYRDAIEVLIRARVMNNGIRIHPDRLISRGEFIKLLSIAHGYTTPVTTVGKKFSDVPKKHSLINYINYGVAMGWINKSNARFRPNDTISQGEIDKLIAVIKKTATSDMVAVASDGVTRGKAASDIVAAFYSP